jgi:hypothetical protein
LSKKFFWGFFLFFSRLYIGIGRTGKRAGERQEEHRESIGETAEKLPKKGPGEGREHRHPATTAGKRKKGQGKYHMSGGIYRPSGKIREPDFKRNGIENAGLGLCVIQRESACIGCQGKDLYGQMEK